MKHADKILGDISYELDEKSFIPFGSTNQILNYKIEDEKTYKEEENIPQKIVQVPINNTESDIERTTNDFAIRESTTAIFNYHKIVDFVFPSIENDVKILFRIPTRPAVLKNNEIALNIRGIKENNPWTSNILIKFISTDFSFSKSIVKLEKTDQQIILKKKNKEKSYQIKAKIYIDNSVRETILLDLWDR